MNDILNDLSGGDLRSEGNAESVARKVVNNGKLMDDLKIGLKEENKLIRGRVCMTLEIISRTHPEQIKELIEDLIDLARTDRTPQIRWHIAEIIPNIDLSSDEKKAFLPIMMDYLDDKSKIVRYCAIQALGFLEKNNKKIIIERIGQCKNITKSIDKIIDKTMERLSNQVHGK